MPKCTECSHNEDAGKFCSQCGGKLEAAPAAGHSLYNDKGKSLYNEKGAGNVSTDQAFRRNCPACDLPIPSGKITCLGDDYHLNCFKCHKCNKLLNLATYRTFEKRFYCGPCIDTGTMYNQWKTTDDAKRFEQKKEEVKMKGGTTVDSGCYLTFDPASGGTLFINWRETKIDGAIAYFKPKKAVPKFKFTNKGGKDELTRGCDQTEMKNYYTGMCNFVKMCKELDGDFIQFKNDHCTVYAHLEGDKVAKWELNSWYDLSTMNRLTVSVQPTLSEAYKGVITIGKDAFIASGARGATLAIK